MPFLMSIFSRSLSGFLLLIFLGFLTACATRDHAQTAATKSSESTPFAQTSANPQPKPQPTPTPKPRLRPTPVATPVPTPTPVLPPAPRPTPPRTAETERGQALSAFLQNGHLLKGEDNALIFVRNEETDAAPSGLFEDAIILGRLRSRLNQVPGLSEKISETATVKEATADLTVSGDLPSPTIARVIDAALATQGIARVRLRF